MKCYYEVLQVDREADDGEIKTAYRKLALKWHPDKNLDNTDLAKDQFQLVQQAYEVLSDRQERAWYDKHREQIIRGANSDFKDENLDLFQFFTTACFKGYQDDDKGFYTVYRKVFEQVAEEDLEYMENKDDFCNIPLFGTSKSNYEEIVGPFYDYWMSYSTKKSYVWLDPHDIREAPNRRVLKLIEKENDKVRQKARKERNEEVRNLVSFVRKRDKRMQVYSKQLEEKKIENRQKQEQFSKQKRLERMQELSECGAEGEWMKFENVKSELEEIEKNLAQEFGETNHSDSYKSEDEEFGDICCVACYKMFKSEKAFKNHESSKKHKENMENLKKTMIDEENRFVLSEFNPSEEEVVVIEQKSKKKNKKAKNVIQVEKSNDVDVAEGTSLQVVGNLSDVEDKSDISSKKQNRRRRKEKQPKAAATSHDNDKLMDNSQQPAVCHLNVDKDHCCVKCKAEFSSKNKLFEHLKGTGHSMYLPSQANSENHEKKKRRYKIK